MSAMQPQYDPWRQSPDMPLSVGSESEIAALVFGRNDRPDALLAAFARKLSTQGHRVIGFVQRGGCASDMLQLVELPGERLHQVATTGPSAHGTAAHDWLRHSDLITSIVDHATAASLIILNRYGTLEQQGQGLLLLIEQCARGGTPLIVAVAEHRFDHWLHRVRGLGVKLRCRPDDLDRWWHSVTGAETPLTNDTVCATLK